MGDLVFFLALLFVEVALTVLIVIGLVWGFFVWRRIRREKKSFAASKGDDAALSMERDRVKARWLRILGVLLWPAVYAAALSFGADSRAAFIAASVSAGACFWRAAILKGRYSASFKENVVKSELSKVFDNLRYEPKGAFDAASIRRLGFFSHADAIEGNDLITAEYKGIRFSQCDLGVEEEYTVTEEDSDGSTHTETRYRGVFRGRAMRFDAAEEFKGTTRVIQRDFEGAKAGAWEKVETELAEFNENFQVFASSGVEALETLKPQVIEGIFWLARAVSAPVALFFRGREMYAFLNLKRDSFDVSGKHTLLEEREFLRQDIKLVTDFLDTMYFKTDGRSGAEKARAREIFSESASASDWALAGRRAKAAVRRGFRKAAARLPYILSAVYVISAVYMVYRLPGGVALSWSGETGAAGPYVPAIAYAAAMGVFVIPGLLGRKAFIGAAALLFHLLLMWWNL